MLELKKTRKKDAVSATIIDNTRNCIYMYIHVEQNINRLANQTWVASMSIVSIVYVVVTRVVTWSS